VFISVHSWFFNCMDTAKEYPGASVTESVPFNGLLVRARIFHSAAMLNVPGEFPSAWMVLPRMSALRRYEILLPSQFNNGQLIQSKRFEEKPLKDGCLIPRDHARNGLHQIGQPEPSCAR
jgi:hypothetical protein